MTEVNHIVPPSTERASILIFGGTTEGRLAIDVCEQAGSTYYYSTKSDMQKIEMQHGIRLSGAMTDNDIITFCREHNVCCIIDAAHPFAENLHHTISMCEIPVIRVQRDFCKQRSGVTYCKDYDDAVQQLRATDINHLLALSGVNTIARLKPYWKEHHTTFRILNRQESREIVFRNQFSIDEVIYYNSDNSIPSFEEEKSLMLSIGCDAIITKESGQAGGFDAKVDAALSLGLKVFVIEHPTLPSNWTYVTGKHGLRRAIEHLVPSFFPLKTGLTTGACATAATKAAAVSLLFDEYPEEISFSLPDGEILSIPVEHISKGVAAVIKDNNDDPDVTKGCRILSKVERTYDFIIPASDNAITSQSNPISATHSDNLITFNQGSGVGKVTLPGLGIPVGEPAINPTPRRMITDELKSLTNEHLTVTISVENGEELAKRTFNHKVGVIGGISIIGTSGIVHPLSNDAFISSIRREINVAWAIGERAIALVAGMKSETALRKERDIRCVHYGNFIGEALKAAHDIGFRRVTLAIMIGKAVKLAEGHLDTHSHKVAMNKDFLRSIAQSIGIDDSPISGITMARELHDVMPAPFFDHIVQLCHSCCLTVFPDGELTIRLIKA